jgi:prepilin-type N-terminal cleavage/methylation domain-containing protein
MRARGFTLIEVLISLVIVATSVTLLMEGYTQALRTITANRTDTTLAFLAQWKMSEVVAGITDPSLNSAGDFTEDGLPPEYTYTIEIAETDTQGLNTVLVTARVAEGEFTRELTLYRLWYAPEESTLGGNLLPGLGDIMQGLPAFGSGSSLFDGTGVGGGGGGRSGR